MSARSKRLRSHLAALARGAGRQPAVRRWRRTVYRGVRRFGRFPILRLNAVVDLPDGGVFVTGILVDPSERIGTMACRYSDGSTRELTSIERWRDPKAALYGSLLADDQPTHVAARTSGTVPRATRRAARGDGEPVSVPVAIRMMFHGGGSRTAGLPRRRRSVDALGSIRDVLQGIPDGAGDKRARFDRLYGPLVSDLWGDRSTRRTAFPGTVIDYNADRSPRAPRTTLLVPIYGRYDFIEYQLAKLANDPSLAQDELLYVIDDPRLHDEVRRSCEQLARIYRIAFRVACLEANLGYAGANNAGAMLARGSHLLLLNSDVLPIHEGWLDRLHACAPPRSVVGARLLYEDGSIQHDGMRFSRNGFMDGLWTNVHPGKGLCPQSLPAGSDATEREAVTGACLLLPAELYHELGGLDEGFVLGDYEDSDLCLAAHALGVPVLLAENVSLWHLERQSQGLFENAWKEQLTYYNCWRHTAKRDGDIQRLHARRSVPAPSVDTGRKAA